MCTLTVVPRTFADGSTGLRIECNRDESVLRPAALPPEFRLAGERRLLAPVDPVGGGTWIGANDAGLVGVLMNVYLAQAEADIVEIELEPSAAPPISRGTIIPRVLAANSLPNALRLADRLEIGRFEPFRLLLFDRHEWSEVLWAAGHFNVGQVRTVSEPLFFTSSGLGDDVVGNPRRALFETLLNESTDLEAAQDAFHRHVWQGREFASVWMTREEARTQSITWIDLNAPSAILRYAARIAATDALEPAVEETLQIG